MCLHAQRKNHTVCVLLYYIHYVDRSEPVRMCTRTKENIKKISTGTHGDYEIQ